MSSGHTSAYVALVNEAKTRVKEVPAQALPRILNEQPDAKLIDTREESEFAAGHVQGAVWLGKGIIERDIEGKYPDRETPLYLYCGSGFRSVLAADNLQKMGYKNVYSVDGGWRDLKDLLPVER